MANFGFQVKRRQGDGTVSFDYDDMYNDVFLPAVPNFFRPKPFADIFAKLDASLERITAGVRRNNDNWLNAVSTLNEIMDNTKTVTDLVNSVQEGARHATHGMSFGVRSGDYVSAITMAETAANYSAAHPHQDMAPIFVVAAGYASHNSRNLSHVLADTVVVPGLATSSTETGRGVALTDKELSELQARVGGGEGSGSKPKGKKGEGKKGKKY